jgi:hypothetical protein
MKKIAIRVLAFALVCASAAPPAHAQDSTAQDASMRTLPRAPRRAFEYGINLGYTQGFGPLQGERVVSDLAAAGVGVGADLGYRVNPGWSVQASGQYNQFKTSDTERNPIDARGALFGIGTTFHMMAYERIDPWVGMGTGYRLLWKAPEGPDNNTLYHGFEFAKVQVGLDVRASKDVVLGPFVGGDLNYFVWKKPEQIEQNQMISDKRVNGFIFAGVQGKFNAGGTRESRPSRTMVSQR